MRASLRVSSAWQALFLQVPSWRVRLVNVKQVLASLDRKQSGFLALSRLAPISVWVGDQKQAIFGFRGTDPALMDAALEALIDRAGDQTQETLKYSWRSRPNWCA